MATVASTVEHRRYEKVIRASDAYREHFTPDSMQLVHAIKNLVDVLERRVKSSHGAVKSSQEEEKSSQEENGGRGQLVLAGIKLPTS